MVAMKNKIKRFLAMSLNLSLNLLEESEIISHEGDRSS